MSTKLNSASRLLRILERANSLPNNMQTLEAWIKLLQVDEDNPSKRALVVGEQIHAMYRELDLIASGMETARFPKTLYDTVIDKVRHALSPMLFATSWDQAKQYFGPDVLTSFAYCSEILPDEESQISVSDLDEIRSKVTELRASLEDVSIPQRLRTLIEHHIDLINRSILEYPISGAKTFREAGRTALGEIIEARDEIAPARGTTAVSTLEATWKKINEVTDIALKLEKIAALGQRAWDAISEIL